MYDRAKRVKWCYLRRSSCGDSLRKTLVERDYYTITDALAKGRIRKPKRMRQIAEMMRQALVNYCEARGQVFHEQHVSGYPYHANCNCIVCIHAEDRLSDD